MRKSRTEFIKEIDVTEPITDMMIIGSDSDPCFGTLHEPTNAICRRCGDAELCAIVMGQRMHKKRLAQGEEFKDVEEPNFDLERMEKYITQKLAVNPNGLSLARIQTLVKNYFSSFEKIDEAYIDKKVLQYVKRSPKYKRFLKNKIKYLKLK